MRFYLRKFGLLFLAFILITTSFNLSNTRAQAPDGTTIAQAETLVDVIYGKDSAAAEKATLEVLRRSGLPIVRADGPLVAAPDQRALADMPIYAEVIPVLARRTVDSAWTLRKFNQLLIDITYFPASVPPAVPAEMIAEWGKLPGSAPEEVFTGAVMRALAAHRGQVFYVGVDPDQAMIDPLTVTLFITHALGTPKTRAGSAHTSERAQTVAYFPDQARLDVCGEISKIFTGNDVVKKSGYEVGRDTVIELWKEVMEHVTHNGGQTLGIGVDVTTISLKTLTVMLLQLGADLKIEVDKPETMFKLKDDAPNDYNKHFHFTAHATFDPQIASKNLGCYAGLGLELPAKGDLSEYYVRWKINGAADKLTPATLVDSYRVSDQAHPKEFDKRLQTDENGKTQLELMPARYVRDGDETRGVELEAHYTITAQLEKQADLPFTPSDLFGIATSGGDLDTFAAKKIFDIVLQALSRYNYPVVKKEVTVKYRGQNIYQIKGQTKIWLFYIEVPVEMDLVACEGLDKPFIGKGGISGDSKTGFGQVAELLTGKAIPNQIAWYNDALNVTAPTAIVPGKDYPYQINGDFKLNLRFSRAPKDNKSHLSGVIGEATVGTDGNNFSAVCDVVGVCNARFKIVGVDSSPECPAGDKITYKLDDSRKE